MVYTHEALPSGPSWKEVKRLVRSLKSNNPADIRDLPIFLLLSAYGLRVGEVVRLQIDDINWELNQISISRTKQRRSQIYPLTPTVGNAIFRYVKNVRPQSFGRALFFTVNAPIRPMTVSSIQHIVHRRFKRLHIQSPHWGPHSLRHACATHLVSEGLTLKEVGDLLGHRYPSSTRVYAKVDINGLREVAAFDLGELR
jgi:site-specific recombinase XerD